MSKKWKIENVDTSNKQHRYPKLNTHNWAMIELLAIYEAVTLASVR